ncbi:MAG TPA: AEC family transporter, partial [Steroidobacteraceae bacterium]
MNSLVLLFACLALGILVAHAARPPAGLAQALNWWVINVALPALVLNVIPRIHFEAQFWFLTAANWLVFIGSWLLFAVLGKLFGWSRARIGALTLVGGLSNAAFMGYPMIEALRGAPGLSLAVIGDQTGCFTAMVIGGVAVTVIYADQELRPWQVLR